MDAVPSLCGPNSFYTVLDNAVLANAVLAKWIVELFLAFVIFLIPSMTSL